MKFIQLGEKALVPVERIQKIEYYTREMVDVFVPESNPVLLTDIDQIRHLEKQLGVEVIEDWFETDDDESTD